jgi:hypothetical protein
MPTFVHDCHQTWLSREVFQRMVLTGFITTAESDLLMITSGTSKYYFVLLTFFLTNFG